MNCPRCGQPVNDGAAFCGNCGQALQQYAPPAATSVPIPLPNTTSTRGEMKAIIGLILGVIGIPASFIPLAGLIFGIAGLVLSTMARANYKRAVSVFGIIFSTLAILTALGAWVWIITHDPKLHKSTAILSSAKASTGVVDTPCYSAKIDSGLNNYKPTGCDFDSSSTTEEFTVASATNSNVTVANLAQSGQKALAASASSGGLTVVSQKTGQFSGSPAYIENMTKTQYGVTRNAIFAVVLHKTSGGANVFIVARVVASGSADSFGALESNWQWK